MKFVLASVILFGLVHPGSKWLMQSGLGLLPFCIFYVGIRLVAQIPIVLATWRQTPLRLTHRQLISLLALGFAGATLQLTEFMGISAGVPVSTVTFLVYTHPVWTFMFSRILNNEVPGGRDWCRLLLAISGIALITFPHFSALSDLRKLIGPTTAGIMLSLWVCLSNRARKEGCSSTTISFFYDLIVVSALLAIQLILGNRLELNSALNWLSDQQHLFRMMLYSLGIGLLPNYLFYRGSDNVSALTAGLLLLLEPVISTLVAWYQWGETLGVMFLTGALLILAAAAPIDDIFSVACGFLSSRSPRKQRDYVAIPISMLVAISVIFLAWSEATARVPTKAELKSIHIVEVIPPSLNDYVVSSELKQVNFAVDLAKGEAKHLWKDCSPVIVRHLQAGSEEELLVKMRQLAAMRPSPVVVGLARSNFARIGAKATSSSDLIGISVGAATAQLKEINPNFVSIASPWSRQWEVIQRDLSQNGCNSKNSAGIFNSGDHLSSLFKAAFQRAGFASTWDANGTTLKALRAATKSTHCLFIGMNFSTAQAFLQELTEPSWRGRVYGIGDWNIYAEELRKFLAKARAKSLTISTPTGWVPSANSRSQSFASKIIEALKETPSPIAAYAYDATLIAISHVCRNHDPRHFDQAALERIPLLRTYEAIETSGNYVSKMYLLQFGGGKQ